MLLQPKTYNWKNDPRADIQIGLIAQDLKKVIPEVVIGNESKEMLSVSYNEIIPVLINALKEQQKELQQLTKSISAAEVNIRQLRVLKKEYSEVTFE